MRHHSLIGFQVGLVSIHASVKDATPSTQPIGLLIMVSIHASVKDATVAKGSTGDKGGFNPRICKRCDIFFS